MPLVLGYFYVSLLRWLVPGRSDWPGSAFHHTYLQATTMTFVGIVACQIGTAFGARAEHASLPAI